MLRIIFDSRVGKPSIENGISFGDVEEWLIRCTVYAKIAGSSPVILVVMPSYSNLVERSVLEAEKCAFESHRRYLNLVYNCVRMSCIVCGMRL